MKKIYVLFIAIVIGFLITGCGSNRKDYKVNIMTTNFPSYDFVRAIIKDVSDINVEMLVKPGTETHDFEPTPQDIIKIKESDLFIYVGGDSDAWIDDIIEDLDIDKSKVIKLMDLVDVVTEEVIDGMEFDEEDEDEKEYDEHVWTSPKNAAVIIEKLYERIIELDYDNIDIYLKNKNEYIGELTKIDNEIRNVVETAKRDVLVFGDRFPLRYFTDEYNLKYYAAFPGCSEQTEASAKTIAYLSNVINKNKIPVVFQIELSTHGIAESISKETGAKVLEFHSAHNVSKDDFDKGITYLDIMKNNVEVLKEALN